MISKAKPHCMAPHQQLLALAAEGPPGPEIVEVSDMLAPWSAHTALNTTNHPARVLCAPETADLVRCAQDLSQRTTAVMARQQQQGDENIALQTALVSSQAAHYASEVRASAALELRDQAAASIRVVAEAALRVQHSEAVSALTAKDAQLAVLTANNSAAQAQQRAEDAERQSGLRAEANTTLANMQLAATTAMGELCAEVARLTTKLEASQEARLRLEAQAAGDRTRLADLERELQRRRDETELVRDDRLSRALERTQQLEERLAALDSRNAALLAEVRLLRQRGPPSFATVTGSAPTTHTTPASPTRTPPAKRPLMEQRQAAPSATTAATNAAACARPEPTANSDGSWAVAAGGRRATPRPTPPAPRPAAGPPATPAPARSPAPTLAARPCLPTAGQTTPRAAPQAPGTKKAETPSSRRMTDAERSAFLRGQRPRAADPIYVRVHLTGLGATQPAKFRSFLREEGVSAGAVAEIMYILPLGKYELLVRRDALPVLRDTLSAVAGQQVCLAPAPRAEDLPTPALKALLKAIPECAEGEEHLLRRRKQVARRRSAARALQERQAPGKPAPEKPPTVPPTPSASARVYSTTTRTLTSASGDPAPAAAGSASGLRQ